MPLLGRLSTRNRAGESTPGEGKDHNRTDGLTNHAISGQLLSGDLAGEDLEKAAVIGSDGLARGAWFERFLTAAGDALRNGDGRRLPSGRRMPFPRTRTENREAVEGRLDVRNSRLQPAVAGHGMQPALSLSEISSADIPAAAVACARAGCAELVTRSMAARLCRYEGKPVCGARCLALMIETAIHRSMAQLDPTFESYQHRMPLGLLMLSRRWITEQQLTVALASQRKAGYGRLGEWLVQAGATDEAQVARAIAAQWGIPWLQSEQHSGGALSLLPRLLVEAFCVAPIRVAAERILYLAVDQKVDPCLNLAIQTITGLRVEPVAMAGRAFRHAQQQLLDVRHPPGRLFRASTLRGLRDIVCAVAGEADASNIRLARVHEYLWLRVERRAGSGRSEDCILAFAVAPGGPAAAGVVGPARGLEN